MMYLAKTTLLSLSSALCWFSVTCARLYPTVPVTNTVFHGGDTNTIAWIDDGHSPSLAELGPLSLDLFVDRATSDPVRVLFLHSLMCHLDTLL